MSRLILFQINLLGVSSHWACAKCVLYWSYYQWHLLRNRRHFVCDARLHHGRRRITLRQTDNNSQGIYTCMHLARLAKRNIHLINPQSGSCQLHFVDGLLLLETFEASSGTRHDNYPITRGSISTDVPFGRVALSPYSDQLEPRLFTRRRATEA